MGDSKSHPAAAGSLAIDPVSVAFHAAMASALAQARADQTPSKVGCEVEFVPGDAGGMTVNTEINGEAISFRVPPPTAP